MLDWFGLESFGILFKTMGDGSHLWKICGGIENIFLKSSPGSTEVQLGFGTAVRHHKFEGPLVGQGVLQVICELCLGPSVPPWRLLRGARDGVHTLLAGA